ncbi:putative phage tail protein [Salsuginibacillus kocurii]|uniref:putative phage tail protein n=1 Tax=Salsuginibacillus kocurii TaxID=427078 RepID=UPI003B84926C
MLRLSNEMINTLPLFLRKSEVYRDIFNSKGEQIQALLTDIEDIEQQMNVDTATWGLDVFEKELNVEIDRSKPYAERRSVIKSQWRGNGQVDADLIRVVADSYTNGDTVVSFNDAIVVEFTSQIGRPPNLSDLQEAIEETKPAHLRVEYDFRYYTIDEVSSMTINELSSIQLENFAGGVS